MNTAELLDRFKEALAHSGLKYTSQRKIIFTALIKNGTFTNAELAKHVSKDVDKATVYRTIDMFEKIHLVNRIWNGWKSKIELSDLFVAHHHHASCSECGVTLRIESDQLEAAIALVAKDLSFTMTSHVLELSGICKNCNNVNKKT